MATIIARNLFIADAILNSAFDGRAIKSSDAHMDRDTLRAWKEHVSAVRVALGLYGTALEEHSEDGIKLSRKAFFDALNACREFGGFTFPNGVGESDECQLWFARLTRVVRVKDADGKIVAAPLALASAETVRKQVELMFALRETGKVGMTIAEYESYKAAKKAAKKAQRSAKNALPAPALSTPAMPMPAPSVEVA